MIAATLTGARSTELESAGDRLPTAGGRPGFAKLQRAAAQSASPMASPMGGGAFGMSASASPMGSGAFGMNAMMMKQVMEQSKRLRKGLPKRDVDIEGKPHPHRILRLNDVIRLVSATDDPVWNGKDRKLKKRLDRMGNEFRKGVVSFADDVQFLERCFDLLDEDGFEELSTKEMMRWVKLLADPAGVGGSDLLWVQTMGAPLGDKEIQKDLVTRVGKNEPNPRFDWQDFVIITVDFYVLAGSAAMRRTFGELLDGHSATSKLVPRPPEQPKKKASLADDVRARRAAMAAKLGKEEADQPPRREAASSATVGSGGGRPARPERGCGADLPLGSCPEDTVDLTNEPLDEEDESRVAEVARRKPPQP